jgi:hypothetical protein
MPAEPAAWEPPLLEPVLQQVGLPCLRNLKEIQRSLKPSLVARKKIQQELFTLSLKPLSKV